MTIVANTRVPLLQRWWPEVVLAVVLLVAPWPLPFIGFNSDIMSRILVWGIFGIGFDLLFGFTGLLSFGQAAFFGTGGFMCAYLLTSGAISSVWLGLLIAILSAAVYGIVIGLLSLRRTGIYFAMITLAFGEMSFFLENAPLRKFTGGENGIPGVPVPTIDLGAFTYHISIGWPLYGLIAILFWVGFLIARGIVRSPFGMVVVSIRKNTRRSVALGHRVQRYKLAVFVVAAAYSGLAGALLGLLQGYMPPSAFTLDTSTQLLMQVVIGGVGTLIGPLVGATVWIWLLNVLQAVPHIGAVWKLILGIVFVVLVMALPRGICGVIARRLGQYTRQRRARAWAGTVGADNRAIGSMTDSSGFAPSAPPGRPPSRVESAAGAPVGAGGIAGGAEGKPGGTPSRTRAHVRQLPARPGTPALEARGLTKRYGGLHAVTAVDVTIANGEFRALIGPNGAGKTTFFKMLAGEVPPTAGDVYLHGVRVTGRGATKVCQLGLCKSYQINQLFAGLTVRENLSIPALARVRGSFRLDMLGDPHRVRGVDERVEQTLALVGLGDRADTPVDVLAYGEKRRLEVGLALATSPTVLLLDEPLAGMSPEERVDIKALLRQIGRDRTVVIVEHDMDAVFELADRVTVLNEGEVLADGTAEEIHGSHEVQDAYLGGIEENELA